MVRSITCLAWTDALSRNGVYEIGFVVFHMGMLTCGDRCKWSCGWRRDEDGISITHFLC